MARNPSMSGRYAILSCNTTRAPSRHACCLTCTVTWLGQRSRTLVDGPDDSESFADQADCVGLTRPNGNIEGQSPVRKAAEAGQQAAGDRCLDRGSAGLLTAQLRS